MNYSSENRICQNCRGSFTIETDDFSFYEKIKVPPPTFCQYCRAERRFAYRNERVLFKVKDAFTGQHIFSLYPEDGKRKSIIREEWHGDTWDALSFGREYDFSKSFFEQFLELRREVPTYNLNVKLMVNSPYCGNATWQTQPNKYHQGLKNFNCTGSYVGYSKNVKDSYLIRESENLRYCQYMQVPGNKDCYDACFWGEHIELLYESSVCGENSYNLKFCANCWPACRDSEYSLDLFSSSNCFGSVGLKKKEYCILNKQYTKEEYGIMVEKIKKHIDEKPYIDSQGLIYKYGELFPIEFSPFGYNNTVAIQHFSISKDEALGKGYSWIEVEKGEYAIM